jgi:hypothetical protein
MCPTAYVNKHPMEQIFRELLYSDMHKNTTIITAAIVWQDFRGFRYKYRHRHGQQFCAVGWRLITYFIQHSLYMYWTYNTR